MPQLGRFAPVPVGDRRHVDCLHASTFSLLVACGHCQGFAKFFEEFLCPFVFSSPLVTSFISCPGIQLPFLGSIGPCLTPSLVLFSVLEWRLSSSLDSASADSSSSCFSSSRSFLLAFPFSACVTRSSFLPYHSPSTMAVEDEDTFNGGEREERSCAAGEEGEEEEGRGKGGRGKLTQKLKRDLKVRQETRLFRSFSSLLFLFVRCLVRGRLR